MHSDVTKKSAQLRKPSSPPGEEDKPRRAPALACAYDAALGAGVGLAVGAGVGSWLGAGVGSWLGSGEGSCDTVGCVEVVGATVGLGVGTPVGLGSSERLSL